MGKLICKVFNLCDSWQMNGEGKKVTRGRKALLEALLEREKWILLLMKESSDLEKGKCT